MMNNEIEQSIQCGCCAGDFDRESIPLAEFFQGQPTCTACGKLILNLQKARQTLKADEDTVRRSLDRLADQEDRLAATAGKLIKV